MIGIYKITNLINGKMYIGQSTNIKERWIKEKSSAFNSLSHTYNTVLSRAFRKYGLENFSFEVIEECSATELNSKERYYIYLYNCLAPIGYNLTDGGDCNRGVVKIGYDTVLSIIQDLKESNLTQLEIAERYGVSKDSITDINLGHTWHNPLLTYPIRNNFPKNKNYCLICGKEIDKSAQLCKCCSSIAQRKVERPDRDTLLEEIANSSFLAVGKKYNVSDTAIRKWCKNYNLPVKKKELVELYKNCLK